MKRAEDTIARVLAGLGEVEPAPGLEERLHRRVREASRERASTRRGLGVCFRGAWRLGAGLAACVMVFAVVALTMQRLAQRGSVGSESTASANLRTGVPGGVHAAKNAQSKPLAAESRGRGAAGSSYAKQVDLKQARNAQRASFEREGPAEITRVSFPAPPMPLLEQERLLLRVAHHGRPEEVAMLEVVRKAAEDGKETEAFQEFFGKPEAAPSPAIQQGNQGESR